MTMLARRGLGFLWLLLTLLIAGSVGLVAYQAGVGVALTNAGTAMPPYGYGFGWGFGFAAFHLFGFLLFLLLVAALFRLAFRFGGRGGWHRGSGWYGPGGKGGYPPHIQTAFDELHRRAHVEAPGSAPDQPPKA
jgi:hypothetical protein